MKLPDKYEYSLVSILVPGTIPAFAISIVVIHVLIEAASTSTSTSTQGQEEGILHNIMHAFEFGAGLGIAVSINFILISFLLGLIIELMSSKDEYYIQSIYDKIRVLQETPSADARKYIPYLVHSKFNKKSVVGSAAMIFIVPIILLALNFQSEYQNQEIISLKDKVFSSIAFLLILIIYHCKNTTYNKKSKISSECYLLIITSHKSRNVYYEKYCPLYVNHEADWVQYLSWLRKDVECVGFNYINRLATRLFLALGISNAIRICVYIIWLSYIMHLSISFYKDSGHMLAHVFSITWVASIHYLLMMLYDKMRIYALWEYDSLLNTRKNLNEKLMDNKWSLRL
jgi:hypothetical protein